MSGRYSFQPNINRTTVAELKQNYDDFQELQNTKKEEIKKKTKERPPPPSFGVAAHAGIVAKKAADTVGDERAEREATRRAFNRRATQPQPRVPSKAGPPRCYNMTTRCRDGCNPPHSHEADCPNSKVSTRKLPNKLPKNCLAACDPPSSHDANCPNRIGNIKKKVRSTALLFSVIIMLIQFCSVLLCVAAKSTSTSSRTTTARARATARSRSQTRIPET